MLSTNSTPFSYISSYFSNASKDTSHLQLMLPQNEYPRPRSNRRLFTTACLSLTVVSVIGLLISAFSTTHRRTLFPQGDILQPEIQPTPKNDPFDSSNYLNGSPTMNFRDNLRPDQKYITSWISAGWTNDVMTYFNLIYLGILTDRIPILYMFTPSHIGGSVPPIRFSEVFDIPRFRVATGRPLLEWHEVKNSSSKDIDELGCWNVWQAVQNREAHPRFSVVPDLLSLDISYTTTPTWTKLIPNFEHDAHSSFWSLAVLGFPEGHRENLVTPRESLYHHVRLPPDEQLLCYDYLYYVCAHQPYEYDFDYSPAWRFVGQHMRWTSRIDSIVDAYVRRTIGIPDDAETPTWIAIHVRHGDFVNWCGDVPVSECFAPLSVIARRVDEVKQELLDRRGLVVEHVIMTSDERNATWWEDVRNRGWYQVDHSQTVELYDGWYPVLIDAAIQSSGMGFVGTDRSTMSILARRRVQSWRDGAVRTVKWGKLDADHH